MSRYTYGDSGYGNYGGLARVWGFGDGDKEKKKGKAYAKGRPKGRPKGSAYAKGRPGPRPQDMLKKLASFMKRPKGMAKRMPKGMPQEAPGKPVALPPAAAASPAVKDINIAPAAASSNTTLPTLPIQQGLPLEPGFLEPAAVPTAQSSNQSITNPAVQMPLQNKVMFLPQMFPGRVPMMRPGQMGPGRGFPARAPQPIIPPRVTPQQARLGAMTAALASALLLF